MLIEIISNIWEINVNELKYSRNEFGKPFFIGVANIHFNISYSKDIIVCVVFDKPIGVDIEYIDKLDMRIVYRIFNENEKPYIDTCESFYHVWTLKESYVKCLGKGLYIPLDSFNVFDPHIFKHLNSYRNAEYIISICCVKEKNMNETRINIQELTLNSNGEIDRYLKDNENKSERWYKIC